MVIPVTFCEESIGIWHNLTKSDAIIRYISYCMPFGSSWFPLGSVELEAITQNSRLRQLQLLQHHTSPKASHEFARHHKWGEGMELWGALGECFQGVSSIPPVLQTNRLHAKLEKSYFVEDLLALSCSSMSLSVPEPSLILFRSLRGTSSLSTSRAVSSVITSVTEI